MSDFCDECGREILHDEELGCVVETRNIIKGRRYTTEMTYCKDCVEERDAYTNQGVQQGVPRETI